MQYRTLGKSGLKVSTLGFGCMRFPQKEVNGEKVFDHETSIDLLRYAIDNGVNYIDTGYHYCDGESEPILGKALLDGYRDKVILSAKIASEAKTIDDARSRLEKTLTDLQTDHLNVFHMWGLNWKDFKESIIKKELAMAIKAKEEGLVKHISFSFHDDAPNMIKIIDEYPEFASVLCQYNILDQSNEESIAYANSKGLGVVVMGPVGGGRLGEPSPAIQKMLPGGSASSVELALRFVLSNPNVTCALSGMGTFDMVKENIQVASTAGALSKEEIVKVHASIAEKKALADLYCTGCNYCMPCPDGVDIPGNFELMNLHKVYGLTNSAKESYKKMVELNRNGKLPASSCVECAKCEKLCPQHLEIIKQLKETHSVLG